MTKRTEAYGNPFATTGTRINTSGETEVKATAGILERIIVNDNGADCTMTIKDGSSTLGIAPLSGDTPRVIECGFNHDDSIKITLGGNDAATNWYKLDSTSGTTATDDGSEADADLTLANMEDGDWEAGKVGQCLHFDGVDEVADSAAALITSSSLPFSWSCWLKFDVEQNSQCPIQQIGYPSGCWSATIHATGYVYISIFKSANSMIYTSFQQDVWQAGTWYLFTVTYDGSNKAAGLSLYINGGRRDLTVVQDTLTPVIFSGALRVGAGFDGTIDDVRIYQVELTEDAVDWIYNGGEGRSDDYAMADVLVVYE